MPRLVPHPYCCACGRAYALTMLEGSFVARKDCECVEVMPSGGGGPAADPAPLFAICEEWKACSTRGPLLRESLGKRIHDLKDASRRARSAYRKPFMAEACSYLADAYDEAASMLERRLEAIQ
jgi:hypothetical protein